MPTEQDCVVGMVRTERTTSRAQAARSATELHPGRAGRTRTAGLVLPEHARYLLRYNPSRRDPRSRTAFLLNPNQADYRLPRSRHVLRRPGAR